jgi:hypothetical protein
MKSVPFACALALLGCSVAIGDPPADPASATIGSGGGTISIANGPLMRIPPGALPTPTQVSIVRSGATQPGSALSPVYAFKPEATTFAQPAVISFPVPAGVTAATIYWSPAQSPGRFEPLPTTIEGNVASAEVRQLGTGYAGVRRGPTRTVSGAMSTVFWQDDGTKTTRRGVLPPGMRVSALYVPNGHGYDKNPVTMANDSSFSVPDVPEGRYLLQVDTITGGAPYELWTQLAQLFELTTSNPDLSMVVAARPDLQVTSLATLVTLDLSNLTPWVSAQSAAAAGDQILIAGSQSDVYVRPHGRYARSVAPGSTSARFSFDWKLMSTWLQVGLPDAAKKDFEFVYQRSTVDIGSGATHGLLHFASRFARLDSLTLRDGQAASLAVTLSDAPQTGTLKAALANAQFAAFAPQVHPTAHPSTVHGVSVLAVPHSLDFPDQPPSTTSVLWIEGPPATDADYGSVHYGQFLGDLWREARYVDYDFDVDLGPEFLAPYGSFISLVSASSPSPIAPVIGPPRDPRIEGRDAFAEQSGVGTEPLLSWSPPSLGSTTSYIVRIRAAAATGTQEVAISIYTGTSVRVPPGLLTKGVKYSAVITAVSAPWDVLDRAPLRTGMPLHTADCLTSGFVP